ncbi:unnamed protein product [Polarella glacialis]|uniref:Uncharacterized protein n=1 Tax=Polarella glacialis TaxID=89957 RepID=A0A813DF10_POLGL|nr:unnamed protein product [Polarella glacialis]
MAVPLGNARALGTFHFVPSDADNPYASPYMAAPSSYMMPTVASIVSATTLGSPPSYMPTHAFLPTGILAAQLPPTQQMVMPQDRSSYYTPSSARPYGVTLAQPEAAGKRGPSWNSAAAASNAEEDLPSSRRPTRLAEKYTPSSASNGSLRKKKGGCCW